MFEWYVVGCANKNKHQNDKKISLCAQNMLTILGSIENMIGENHVRSLNEHKDLHFDNAEVFK